jgi:hypothetical protein
MHDGEAESQDTTELCDAYLVVSELCGVCCVLWCVGSGFQVQGLGSGNLDPMRATSSRALHATLMICIVVSLNKRWSQFVFCSSYPTANDDETNLKTARFRF